MLFPFGKIDPEQIADVLQSLRRGTPRVHCITNAVAQTFTANVLLAAGAVPSMTIAPEEVEGFARSADAVLVNLGTLDATRKEAIPLALSAAKSAGLPVVLDPVFVNRSPVRCAYARSLLAQSPSILRANQEEMSSLFPAVPPLEALNGTGIALAMTGPEDVVWLEGRSVRLANGVPMLSRVTATGCAGGGLLAAFLAIETDPVLAAVSGLTVFNVAGEIAAERAAGPGSLEPELLDALYNLTSNDIVERFKTAEQED